jgi:hypothetical protein
LPPATTTTTIISGTTTAVIIAIIITVAIIINYLAIAVISLHVLLMMMASVSPIIGRTLSPPRTPFHPPPPFALTHTPGRREHRRLDPGLP